MIQVLLSVSAFATSSDDPFQYPGSYDRMYRPRISAPQWIIPAGRLPSNIQTEHSNNNVSITKYDGKIYLAWRSSETHFASKNTKLHIISSSNDGHSWNFEHTIQQNSDKREPFLIEIQNELFLYFFQGGTKPTAFEPKKVWRTRKMPSGAWGSVEEAGLAGEVPWELKVRQGVVYKTSYIGPHYQTGPSRIYVLFQKSLDGLNWQPVLNQSAVYLGGVSEVGFEFDSHENIWAVTRNEDGDKSGWGSHLVFAPKDQNWQFPQKSNPERFDSPRMFRHGSEMYLIARRDIGGPFDRSLAWLPFQVQKWLNLVMYSLRPKKTSLYKINKTKRSIEWVFDLPSEGDTAFPSIFRTSEHEFLIANYTSDISQERTPWIKGQLSRKGTQIYMAKITFE